MASPVHNMMVKMARAGINWSPSKTKRANLDNQIDEKSFPIAGANPTGEKKKKVWLTRHFDVCGWGFILMKQWKSIRLNWIGGDRKRGGGAMLKSTRARQTLTDDCWVFRFLLWNFWPWWWITVTFGNARTLDKTSYFKSKEMAALNFVICYPPLL